MPDRERDDVPILALCAIAGGYDVNGLYRKVNEESIKRGNRVKILLKQSSIEVLGNEQNLPKRAHHQEERSVWRQYLHSLHRGSARAAVTLVAVGMFHCPIQLFPDRAG